jgi:hypothetical protein
MAMTGKILTETSIYFVEQLHSRGGAENITRRGELKGFNNMFSPRLRYLRASA